MAKVLNKTGKPNPDVSVWDYMTSKGKQGDLATRKKAFSEYVKANPNDFGTAEYTGSETQNIKLLEHLKAGKVKLDGVADVNKIIPRGTTVVAQPKTKSTISSNNTKSNSTTTTKPSTNNTNANPSTKSTLGTSTKNYVVNPKMGNNNLNLPKVIDKPITYQPQRPSIVPSISNALNPNNKFVSKTVVDNRTPAQKERAKIKAQKELDERRRYLAINKPKPKYTAKSVAAPEDKSSQEVRDLFNNVKTPKKKAVPYKKDNFGRVLKFNDVIR